MQSFIVDRDQTERLNRFMWYLNSRGLPVCKRDGKTATILDIMGFGDNIHPANGVALDFRRMNRVKCDTSVGGVRQVSKGYMVCVWNGSRFLKIGVYGERDVAIAQYKKYAVMMDAVDLDGTGGAEIRLVPKEEARAETAKRKVEEARAKARQKEAKNTDVKTRGKNALHNTAVSYGVRDATRAVEPATPQTKITRTVKKRAGETPLTDSRPKPAGEPDKIDYEGIAMGMYEVNKNAKKQAYDPKEYFKTHPERQLRMTRDQELFRKDMQAIGKNLVLKTARGWIPIGKKTPPLSTGIIVRNWEEATGYPAGTEPECTPVLYMYKMTEAEINELNEYLRCSVHVQNGDDCEM